MDKNYETYEYQSGSNANDVTQFIVVQNSGTFLTVNDKPVQYITQVEDLKENDDGVQTNIVYDVTPQEYYVNVDNPSEVMSVSDQFIIPDGENNMYTNNYLLSTAEDNKVEQMEQDKFEQNTSVQANAEVEMADCKNSDDCNQIPLSDDQYQFFKQEGWILLERRNKIYLVDTLGLRDITEDKKLIEKLKQVINEKSSNVVSDEVSYENEGHFASNSIEDSIDFMIKRDVKQEDVEQVEDVIQQNQDVQSYLDDNPEPVQPQEIVEKHTNDIAYVAAEHDYVKVTSFKDTSYRREGEALRIKTKFSFKDIPPEIVLGRTVHGKKLVASVKTENIKSALTNKAVGEKFQRVPAEEYDKHVQNNPGLDEKKLHYLIQEHFRGNTESLSLNDVNAAEIVVEQLLQVPNFKATVMERRLLITKVVIDQYETRENCTAEILPVMVTGYVVKTDTKVVFKHIPDLLQQSLATAQDGGTNDEDKFLHIHVQEIKGVDGITRISIVLNKQNIPLMDLAKNARNKQNMVYACGSCAAIYNTEEGLNLHLETDCMNVNNLVTVDADNSNNNYSAVFTDKGKEYMCNQCHSIFKKLSSCQKHMKNNCSSDTPGKNDKRGNSKELFNCIMCDRKFQHQGSLSKHIITKHVKIPSSF